MIDVLEVNSVSLAYLVLGGFVVVFSMVSLLVKEKLYIGEVVIGTIFGIIIGPHCANIFNPNSWGSDLESQNRITLEVMRIVLATGLFAIGVELPKAYVAEHVRSLLVMVVPTMAFGWLISAVIIRALFPALSFVSSLAISACLTPTDPVLASSIIGGNYAIKNVPGHLRRILSAESAANDGLAYPFLSISIYLAIETSKGVAFRNWIIVGWLYQVILGAVLGALLGFMFSYVMKLSHRKGWLDRESYIAQYLAFAILTIGIASTLGTDDLLAAFAAGTTISWDGHFNHQTEEEAFSSIIDLVLNCASFIYIGAWLPLDKYNASDLGIEPWRLVVLFIAILFLRRIPCMLLLYKFIPDVHNWREALFCGHFGPIGVGAVYISTLALTELPQPSNPPGNQNEFLAATIHPIVSFIVLCSIMIHGLSIPAFWFGRRMHSRTLSLTTSMSRTRTLTRGDQQPDWLIGARRATPSESAQPATGASGAQITDLERGPQIEETDTSKGQIITAGYEGGASVHVHDENDLSMHKDRITDDIAEESPISNKQNLGRGKEAAREVSDGSLEHGVHVVTDGKEEVVGHGYASLRPADDSSVPELGAEHRGKGSNATTKEGSIPQPPVQDENQGLQAETQINTSKSVSFAQ